MPFDLYHFLPKYKKEITHIIILFSFFQKFHNATACQVLGNLCTLTLHAKDHPACQVLYELIYSNRKRYEEVPRLFYDREKQKIPINREDITTVYKLRETDTGEREHSDGTENF